METFIQHLPGYQVNEYKIIIIPHEDLARRIMEIKKQFNQKYEVEGVSISIPQVILAHFKQIRSAEERIINRLRLIAMGSHPLKVEIKDYGSYPSHTIFLDIPSPSLTDLVKKIRQDSQRLMKADANNPPHFMSNGHLTIARKLKPWQYNKAWMEYSKRHFTGKFIANNMILVKRKPGEFKYTPVASFELMNLPVDIKQGELF